jgi:hypothetical protein
VRRQRRRRAAATRQPANDERHPGAEAATAAGSALAIRSGYEMRGAAIDQLGVDAAD